MLGLNKMLRVSGSMLGLNLCASPNCCPKLFYRSRLKGKGGKFSAIGIVWLLSMARSLIFSPQVVKPSEEWDSVISLRHSDHQGNDKQDNFKVMKNKSLHYGGSSRCSSRCLAFFSFFPPKQDNENKTVPKELQWQKLLWRWNWRKACREVKIASASWQISLISL